MALEKYVYFLQKEIDNKKDQTNNKDFFVYSDFVHLTSKLNVLFGIINIPYMGTVELIVT